MASLKRIMTEMRSRHKPFAIGQVRSNGVRDWSTLMLALRLRSQLMIGPNKTHKVWNYAIIELKISVINSINDYLVLYNKNVLKYYLTMKNYEYYSNWS